MFHSAEQVAFPYPAGNRAGRQHDSCLVVDHSLSPREVPPCTTRGPEKLPGSCVLEKTRRC